MESDTFVNPFGKQLFMPDELFPTAEAVGGEYPNPLG